MWVLTDWLNWLILSKLWNLCTEVFTKFLYILLMSVGSTVMLPISLLILVICVLSFFLVSLARSLSKLLVKPLVLFKEPAFFFFSNVCMHAILLHEFKNAKFPLHSFSAFMNFSKWYFHFNLVQYLKLSLESVFFNLQVFWNSPDIFLLPIYFHCGLGADIAWFLFF